MVHGITAALYNCTHQSSWNFKILKKLSVPWCTRKLLIGMAKYVLERMFSVKLWLYFIHFYDWDCFVDVWSSSSIVFHQEDSSKAARNVKTNHFFNSFCYSEFSRKGMIWGLSLRLQGSLFVYKQNFSILNRRLDSRSMPKGCPEISMIRSTSASLMTDQKQLFM